MERERIRCIYDARAATYDRSVGVGERILLGDLRRRFGAALHGETLEIAVGSGLNFPFYSAAVTRAVGVDLSRGMLTQAAARAAALGRDIALLQMDAQRLAFADAAFDTVAISLALCTVPDPDAALREIARVCRPGGTVVLLEHVRSPLRPVAFLERLVSPLQERALGCHLDRASIDLARAHGFTILAETRRIAGVFRLAIARPPAL